MSKPRGVVVERSDAWVACTGGELVRVDLDAGEPVQVHYVDTDLRDVVVSGDELWVSRFRSAELLLVDPADGSVFHRATPGGMACASCHLEGHEDGRTWSFADLGDFRTPDLAGIVGTEPFHWQGDTDTLGALMTEVHERRMGSVSTRQGAAAGRALSRFLEVIPPSRPSVLGTGPELQQGERLFGSLGCADCHTDPPPAQGFDVGTGGPFQVPRLASVSMRLPLMHDGCARSLRARFEDQACGGADHGSVAHLTDQQLDHLILYVESL